VRGTGRNGKPHLLRVARPVDARRNRQSAQIRQPGEPAEQAARGLREIDMHDEPRRVGIALQLIGAGGVAPIDFEGEIELRHRNETSPPLYFKTARDTGDRGREVKRRDAQRLEVDSDRQLRFTSPGRLFVRRRLAMHREPPELEVRHARFAPQQAAWRPVQVKIGRDAPHAIAVAHLDACDPQPIREASREAFEHYPAAARLRHHALDRAPPGVGVADRDDERRENKRQNDDRRQRPHRHSRGAAHQKACPRPM
jgi:hypothetical protein